MDCFTVRDANGQAPAYCAGQRAAGRWENRNLPAPILRVGGQAVLSRLYIFAKPLTLAPGVVI